jgi:diguanylate cyclase (GGDEF)-like protein
MPAARSGTDRDPVSGLGFYRFLNRLGWPKSYLGRLLLVCALASCVPLLASLGLVVFGGDAIAHGRFGLIAGIVAGHLAAIGLMLVGLRLALEPVRLSVDALDSYQRDRCLPQLPTQYDDEPGRLMREIRRTILSVESVHADLLNSAETDPLTEIANRRRLLRRGTEALAEARRAGTTLSLVILDIDRFKSVNDTYGHPAGDLVLRLVSGLVGRDLRDGDSIARIGGEEFAILLPDTPLAQAVLIAERLRYRIGSLPIPALDGAGVTASFGVTAAGSDDPGIERIMHRADAALYDAKRGGRDCVAYRPADSVGGDGGDGDCFAPEKAPLAAVVKRAAAGAGKGDVAWIVD